MRQKLFGLIARRAHLSAQEFHDHYRHPHGTMGVCISTLGDYVQSHQIHTNCLGEQQARYDAVAELWFDSAADIANFRKEPVMAGFLNEDEWRFVDMKASTHFVGEEEVLSSRIDEDLCENDADRAWRLHNRPISIKLLQFFPASLGSEWCSADDLNIGRALRAYRHVRCHPTPPISIMKTDKPRPPQFAGARELWWPTKTVFERSVAAAPEAWKQLVGGQGVHSMLAQAERFR